MSGQAHTPRTGHETPLANELILSEVTRRTGLPSSQIHALAQTRDRTLWLATPAGLASYDGAHVRTWGREAGLSSHGLRALAADPRGLLWIGSDGGLDAFDESAHAVDWKSTVDWPFGLVDRITVQADGRLLVATSRGLVQLATDPGQPFEVIAHFDVGLVVDVAELPDDRWVCALASNEVIVGDSNGIARVRNPELQALGALTALVVANADTVLVSGQAGMAVLSLSSGAMQWVVRGSAVEAMLIDQGTVWFGAGASLRCAPLADLGTARLVMERCRANDLLRDADGNLWIATDNSGVRKLSCLRAYLEFDAAFGARPVYCIREDAQNVIVSGDGKLLCHGEHGTRVYPVRDLTIWDAVPDPDDPERLWLATQQGLFRVDPASEPEVMWSRHRILGSPGRCLQSSEAGLWVGTLSGLCRIDRDQVREFGGKAGETLGYVYTLATAPDGRLWAGTLGRGLWRQEGNHFTQVCEGDARPDSNTYAISFNAAGRALVTQDTQLLCEARDQTLRAVYSSREAVAGWSACWLGEARALLGSTSGLIVIDVETGEEMQRVNAICGGPDWEFTTSRSLCRSADGRLHCGTNAGRIEVDIERLEALPSPPSCRVARFRWENVQPESRNGVLYVRPGKWAFRLDVASVWFIDESSLEYRFKLAGFDENWSPYAREGTVQFSSLPSGRYELHAQARSSLSGEGPTACLATIEVESKGAILGALEATLDGIDERLARLRKWRRNRVLLQENHQVQAEVARQTRQLEAANDELRATVGRLREMSNSDPLTGIGNRRRFDAALARELERCQRKGRPLALALIDVDHFKKFNDRYGHQAGDDCLRVVAQVLRDSVRDPPDVAARYGGEEFAAILPEQDVESARKVAERLRQALQSAGIEHLDNAEGGGRVSASIGLAVDDGTDSTAQAADLIARADAVLYRAKSNGRNRVEIDDQDSPPGAIA